MAEPSINERVAEEIRVLLARRRLSASDLARMTGMTQRAISRRLTGEKVIDVEDLEKISRVLDVEVTDLLPRPMPGRVVATSGSRPNAGSGGSSERATQKRIPKVPCPIGGPRKDQTAPGSAIEPNQRRPMLVSAPGQRIAA